MTLLPISNLKGDPGLTMRGILADGASLDTLVGSSSDGVYRLQAGFSFAGLPASKSSQAANLLVLSSTGGQSTAQVYIAFDRMLFRNRAGSAWGVWRRVVAHPETETPYDPSPKLLTLSDDLDALAPGVYYVNYSTTAAQLGLPPRVGSLHVLQITTTMRLQRFETAFGDAETVSGTHFPYEVWIRGMDRGEGGERLYHPQFTKLYSTDDEPEPGSAIPHTVVAPHALSTTAPDEPRYVKGEDVLDRPASTTKVLTGVIARTVVTDALLDDTVTVLETDPNPGGSGSGIPLQVGDVVTFRDLFYLTMLPSHNQAASILARAAGALLPGSGDTYDRFVAEMQAVATDWWGAGRVFVNPTGLGSTNQVAASDLVDLMYRASDDPFLVECMGAESYTVNVDGPNARTLNAVHSVQRDGAVKFPDMVAAKSGTLSGHACLVMLYRLSTGGYGAAALLGSNPANRYLDMRQIINYAHEGPDRGFLV